MNSNTDIFCFDSSIFINFHRSYPQKVFPDLWTCLAELMDEGRLISHSVVFDEITAAGFQDDLSKWATPRKSRFHSMSANQTEYIGAILANFPKLINPEQEREQADCWLIAMIREIMEDTGLFGDDSSYILATAENKKKGNRIPAACKHFDIRCMDQFEFFDAIGIQFNVSRIR